MLEKKTKQKKKLIFERRIFDVRDTTRDNPASQAILYCR